MLLGQIGTDLVKLFIFKRIHNDTTVVLKKFSSVVRPRSQLVWYQHLSELNQLVQYIVGNYLNVTWSDWSDRSGEVIQLQTDSE